MPVNMECIKPGSACYTETTNQLKTSKFDVCSLLITMNLKGLSLMKAYMKNMMQKHKYYIQHTFGHKCSADRSSIKFSRLLTNWITKPYISLYYASLQREIISTRISA